MSAGICAAELELKLIGSFVAFPGLYTRLDLDFHSILINDYYQKTMETQTFTRKQVLQVSSQKALSASINIHTKNIISLPQIAKAE